MRHAVNLNQQTAMKNPFSSPIRGILLSCLGFGVNAIPCPLQAQQLVAPKERPSILWIVADDMNWDSPGCFGGAAPGITPRIDRLAQEGIRFEHAYVNISICTPSRSVLLTGLYPNRNGAEGFQRIHPGTPNLPARLGEAGYLCGIIGKPLRQQDLLRWSVTYQWPGVGDEDLWGRDPVVFRRFAKSFFTMARNANQPFFLMANSHDPHRPFGGENATRPHEQLAPASRTYQAHEVRVPGFLPDLPEVRQDLADYCTSVRRLDDMVGGLLEELEAAGLAEETLVIFMSDHGMPFPSAKFNCYVQSTRSPWVIRWPGFIKPGSVDTTHMISAIDLMPTLLDVAGLPSVQTCDGQSFLPLLYGGTQSGRDHILTQFYHIHGDDALPMRSVITRTAAYVFNPWANGKRPFRRLGSPAFRAMESAASTNPDLNKRVRSLRFRQIEEFFDLQSDPDCLNNLIEEDGRLKSEASHLHSQRSELEGLLTRWMKRVGDPALDAFHNRHRSAILETYLQSYRHSASEAVEALKPYERTQGFRF